MLCVRVSVCQNKTKKMVLETSFGVDEVVASILAQFVCCGEYAKSCWHDSIANLQLLQM